MLFDRFYCESFTALFCGYLSLNHLRLLGSFSHVLDTAQFGQQYNTSSLYIDTRVCSTEAWTYVIF